jgi:hypothetical protein
MKLPSEKQIEYAEYLASIFEVDFPTSSRDFTARAYHAFIEKYNAELRERRIEAIADEEYCYDICQNDVWCEEY